MEQSWYNKDSIIKDLMQLTQGTVPLKLDVISKNKPKKAYIEEEIEDDSEDSESECSNGLPVKFDPPDLTEIPKLLSMVAEQDQQDEEPKNNEEILKKSILKPNIGKYIPRNPVNRSITDQATVSPLDKKPTTQESTEGNASKTNVHITIMSDPSTMFKKKVLPASIKLTEPNIKSTAPSSPPPVKEGNGDSEYAKELYEQFKKSAESSKVTTKATASSIKATASSIKSTAPSSPPQVKEGNGDSEYAKELYEQFKKSAESSKVTTKGTTWSNLYEVLQERDKEIRLKQKQKKHNSGS